MKNLSYQKLESVGSVMWLLTDFIWMCGFHMIAGILTIPTFLLMVGSCIRFNGKKRSELFSLTAATCWFLMNMCWIYSDITEPALYLLCAKLSFIPACFFVYLSFKAAKKENGPTDFTRLKIK